MAEQKNYESASRFMKEFFPNGMGEFKGPRARYHPEEDELIYLERGDCSYRAQHLAGCNFELLLEPDSGKIIGMKVRNFSEAAGFNFDGKRKKDDETCQADGDMVR